MDPKTIEAKYGGALASVLNERSRRLWAATEARALGHGGIAVVERATGISRSTIQRGLRELESGEVLDPDRVRRPGGGRKRAVDKDETLLSDLDALVEPTAAGSEAPAGFGGPEGPGGGAEGGDPWADLGEGGPSTETMEALDEDGQENPWMADLEREEAANQPPPAADDEDAMAEWYRQQEESTAKSEKGRRFGRKR